MTITADDIKNVRAFLDMTQAEFAGLLDVSVRTVGTWENSGVPEAKQARAKLILDRYLTEMHLLEAEAAEHESLHPDGPDDFPAELLEGTEGSAVRTPSPAERLARLLSPFSSRDLLSELDRRHRVAGGVLNIWNAARVEKFQQFISPEWEAETDVIRPNFQGVSEASRKLRAAKRGGDGRRQSVEGAAGSDT